MNLQQMREKVKALMDYRSDAQVTNDDIDRALNDAIDTVWNTRSWTFSEKVAQLAILPDITPGLPGIPASCLLVNYSRLVVFSGVVTDLLPDATATVLPGRSWVGQFLYVDRRYYKIIRVQDDALAVILEEPIRLTSGAASEVVTNWVLKWMRISIPEDCQEILGIVTNDFPANGTYPGVRIPGLMAREAEAIMARIDQAGFPDFYVNDENVNLPPGGTLTAVANEGGGATTDTYGFVVPRYYELTWAFCAAGKVGPLAVPVVVQVPAPGNDPSKIDLELFASDGVTPAKAVDASPTDSPYPVAYEGLKKRFFFNSNLDVTTGLRKGLPSWREVNRRHKLTVTPDDSFALEIDDNENTVSIHQPFQVQPNNARVAQEPDGVYQVIRFWPRPNYFTLIFPELEISADNTAPAIKYNQFRVRYNLRPPKCWENQDAPIGLPVEFHMVVVNFAASTMLIRLGDQVMAQTYRTLALEGMNSMVNKYTERTDVNIQRGNAWGDTGPVYGVQWQGLMRLRP